MTLAEDLLDRAAEYLPKDKVGAVGEAYRFAERAHEGQTRLSGEPFVEHPLQTALYLAELHLDSDALAAALLHDVMEDCDVGYDEISRLFGEEVAKLVDGVTKLTRTEFFVDCRGGGPSGESNEDLARAESLRKMLMTMADDVRVVLIKLADRLHNMRTLKALPKDRRVAIAQETLDIYAPLAHRLGIWEMKWRLEDLAFQHINPQVYREISKLLRAKRAEREEYIQGVISVLEGEMEAAGIGAEVTGRPKHIYSVFKKMNRYAAENKEVGEIYDLFALRVLVEEVRDCYAGLGVVHSKWRPLPGQFDDYIANPKDNLYQSLHTSVLCEGGSPVEVQIRTHDMHQLAEYGVAAHWLYKEGEASDVQFEEKMAWLRQLLDWQREVDGAEEFVESFKTDIFKNQVFVYTPKGDLKELPVAATPLDFAFRIHTDVGYGCIAAKVNDKLVPLSYELGNGDTVEILTSDADKGPSPDWLNPNLGYVKTGYAREKIHQWFNRQTRKANRERGSEIFREQLLRLNRALDVTEVARLMKFDTADAFLAALGSERITTEQVVNRLSSLQVKPQDAPQATLPSVGPGSGIEVRGVGDLLTSMARCCNPIPGEEIVGYINRSSGVTIHGRSCPNMVGEGERGRLLEVGWGKTKTIYPVRVRIEAWDRVGLLRDITSVVSADHVNIALVVTEEDGDISIVTLTAHINGIDQLSRLFSKLEGIEGVVQVARED